MRWWSLGSENGCSFYPHRLKLLGDPFLIILSKKNPDALQYLHLKLKKAVYHRAHREHRDQSLQLFRFLKTINCYTFKLSEGKRHHADCKTSLLL